MARPEKSGLRGLRSLRWMPWPDRTHVHDYGKEYVGDAHEVMLFPAAIREAPVREAGVVLEEGQSGCYFHPRLTATAICELSGRMICELCCTEWQGKQVSFEALQGALSRGEVDKEAGIRLRWDNIALSLAVYPLLLWFITLVTAPAALFIVIWKWRKGPCSVVHRSRWRFVLAGLLAGVQIAGWGTLLFFSVMGA
jgi:hypothetical protein